MEAINTDPGLVAPSQNNRPGFCIRYCSKSITGISSATRRLLAILCNACTMWPMRQGTCCSVHLTTYFDVSPSVDTGNLDCVTYQWLLQPYYRSGPSSGMQDIHFWFS
eukprot:5448815-Amphidinium_carterae.1